MICCFICQWQKICSDKYKLSRKVFNINMEIMIIEYSNSGSYFFLMPREGEKLQYCGPNQRCQKDYKTWIILSAGSWFSDHEWCILEWGTDFLLYVGGRGPLLWPESSQKESKEHHQNMNDSNCWIIDLGSKARMEKLFGSKLEDNSLALPTSLTSRLKVK